MKILRDAAGLPDGSEQIPVERCVVTLADGIYLGLSLSQALFASRIAHQVSAPAHKKHVICLTIRLRRSRNGNAGGWSLTCINDSNDVPLSARDLSAIAPTPI
ncbi:hypothetical protein [Mycobacterium sp. DBP42]|uniref:hypothetical protein n=1 Tax=Mycobacterium sp. DBP42 TaxID=2545267 RepID=UPI00110CFB73|nr:hypothetical protein [Mycobacterium sp. DBP42]TMS53457.1 hypothetical protein E0T84_10955 [Mycobacterium sp. DBP42]